MGVGIYFYAVTEAEVQMIEDLGELVDNEDLYEMLGELPQADFSLPLQLPDDLDRLCALLVQSTLLEQLESQVYTDDIADRIWRVRPGLAAAAAALDDEAGYRWAESFTEPGPALGAVLALREVGRLAQERVMLLQIVG